MDLSSVPLQQLLGELSNRWQTLSGPAPVEDADFAEAVSKLGPPLTMPAPDPRLTTSLH